MNGIRKILAESIDAHKTAIAGVESAAAAVENGKAYIRKLESEIATFDGVEAEVSAARAESIKASMAGGDVPRFALCPELQTSVLARAEASATLTAARQAAASLAGQHSDAVALERDAKGHVESLANAVMMDEIERLSKEITGLESQTLALRTKLHGASRVWTILNGSRASRFKLPALAIETLHAKSPREEIESTRSPAQNLAIAKADRWREYIDELTTDANAMFEPA